MRSCLSRVFNVSVTRHEGLRLLRAGFVKMRMACWVFCASWMLASVASAFAADFPSIEELLKKSRERVESIDSHRFEYSVRERTWASESRGPITAEISEVSSPAWVERVDVTTVLQHAEALGELALRTWVRHKVQESTKGELTGFACFDGSEVRRFDIHASGGGRYRRGDVLTQPHTAFFENNRFEGFLSTDLNDFLIFSSPRWSHSDKVDLSAARVDSLVQRHGRDALLVSRAFPKLKTRTKQVIIGHPFYLVVEQHSEMLLDGAWSTMQRSVVTSVTEFQGQLFADAGYFVECPSGNQPRYEYQFSNTSISTVAKIRCPDWPPGTAVRYSDGRDMVLIPHDPRE